MLEEFIKLPGAARNRGSGADPEGARVVAAVEPDADLPADTMLWARLQSVSGGIWGGCVYDHEAIALEETPPNLGTPIIVDETET